MVKKSRPWPAFVLCVLMVLVIYTSIVLLISDIPGGAVLYESKQPEDIKYGSFDPYVLRIVEGPIKWNMLGWHRSSIIRVTRSPDSSYGHFINTDMNILCGDVNSIVWSPGGIEICYSRGHKLFIPKTAYIGGR